MSCKHFKQFKEELGLQNYETIHRCFIAGSAAKNSTYHQVFQACFDCTPYNNLGRLLACMHCIYFGCYNSHATGHAIKKSHNLSIELSNGHIYCHSCKDYIYDSDVEDVRSSNSKRGISPQVTSWKPNKAENKLLQEHPKRLKLEPSTIIGIRGLVNFGSTCYMNSIMQTLLHTPILRDYFFTDKHKCHCSKATDCLFCHFSRLYQRYYSEGVTNLSLHEILSFFWKNDINLFGIGEKDAHEFLISALNFLHKFSSPGNSSSHDRCSCIIDLIFQGEMQSDIVYQSCGNVSTKIDPFRDISLDIPDSPNVVELTECLKHFTRAESFDEVKFTCSACGNKELITKQLTFHVLPLVIIIHLKRVANGKKKNTVIKFPMELDMTPFVSGKRNEGTENHNSSDKDSDNRYTLYAVVVHDGVSNTTGHYSVNIRRTKHKWFSFSDIKIAPVDAEQVLELEGYLLFYHKTLISYK